MTDISSLSDRLLLAIRICVLALLLSGCAGIGQRPLDPAAALGDPVGTLRPVGEPARQVDVDDLEFTGRASYVYPGDEIYAGELLDGLPHGRGSLLRADGTRYDGEWEAGLKMGHGRMALAGGGGTYEGDFAYDRRHGRGVYNGPDGRYEGDWFDGLPHGYGRYDYSDGHHYEGEWFRGQRSGEGVMVQVDGSRYEGDWRSGKPGGFGRLEASDGSSLDGFWEDGSFSGYGRYEDQRGVTYEGMWTDGKRNGYGLESLPNGHRYLGEFVDNRRHGRGRWSAGEVESHDGVWAAGQPAGPGVRTTRAGVRFEGEWRGARLDRGTVLLPSGARFDGEIVLDGSNDPPDAMTLAQLHPDYREWLGARADADDGHACYLLARAIRDGADTPRAALLDRLECGARAGVPQAQLELAELLLSADEPRALALLEAAAAGGSVRAHLYLGGFAQLGDHVTLDHERARRHFEVAAASGNVTGQNNLAWLLATSPFTAIRDGARAVRIMAPLVRFVPVFGYFDTLAAAYAEDGDFDRALQWQQRAVDALSEEIPIQLRAEVEQRLEDYARRRPWREPQELPQDFVAPEG